MTIKDYNKATLKLKQFINWCEPQPIDQIERFREVREVKTRYLSMVFEEMHKPWNMNCNLMLDWKVKTYDTKTKRIVRYTLFD